LHSNPEEIFTFFESLYELCSFKVPLHAVIKRYKNCIYYGEKIAKSSKEIYRGMFWTFKRIWYYGQLVDGKKHGTGVEIDLPTSTVWKGKFVHGRKTGYFHIESPAMKYYGSVLDGHYHGEGQLITSASEYKGGFQHGLREGNGLEKFSNKSEYKGEYFNNKFDGHGEMKAGSYYYQGLFKCGKPDGYGFERTENYEYLGDFMMGVKEGRGKIKTKDGVTVECMFVAGLAVDKREVGGSPSSTCGNLDRNLSS
jgi:hypothetical protein